MDKEQNDMFDVFDDIEYYRPNKNERKHQARNDRHNVKSDLKEYLYKEYISYDIKEEEDDEQV